jgi:cob(I)alamin adenosyltransferase
MRIYTRQGDDGQTGLIGGARVSKDDPRVDAYGCVDELGAALGVARAAGPDPELDAGLARVQGELFSLGASLAAPAPDARVPRVQRAWVDALEHEIDRADTELTPLRHFVLPGGCPAAAALHLARAVCRRAERAIVALSRREAVDPLALAFVNRLSDWLFTMARLANHRANVSEREWTKP